MNQPTFEPQTPQDEKKESIKSFAWETLKVIIISLIIILPIRYYVIQPFYVKGASMEPNFYDHEYLIIDEISYRFDQPQRGDIVVFRYPKNPTDFFIKRIIALPGEKIEIKDGQITIHNSQNPAGFILDESTYLPEENKTYEEINLLLADDEYFVLGDNRMSSLDSRRFGPIKRSDIIGRTWLRSWPIDRFTVFKTPEYN